MHINVRTLRKIHKYAEDLPQLKVNLPPCAPCMLGKAKKKCFDSEFDQATYPGEVVHSDVVGPLPVSTEGSRYIVTLQDQYSRLLHVTGVSTKAEAATVVERYKSDPLVVKHFRKGVERLHTDGGGEYENVDVIDPTKTTPHTPEHNPFSERINRTILEPIRVLLEQSGLSEKYWEFALMHVAYIKNRVPHSALGCSPIEKLTGVKPNLHNIRTFGCSSFIYEHNPKSKVHSRAAPGILLGCNDHSNYTVMRQNSRKIERSVHVTFIEDQFPGLEQFESSSSGEDAEGYETDESNENRSLKASQDNDGFNHLDVSTDDDIPAEQVVHEQIQSYEFENSNPDDPQEQCIYVSSRLPKRNRKKPQRLTYNAGKNSSG